MAGLTKPVEGESGRERPAGGREDATGRTEVDDNDERKKEELRGGGERDCEARDEER